MFEWFRNYSKSEGSIAEDMSKVIPFPEPKLVPAMPEVLPPKEEKPAITYYRLGITSNNRVSLAMGYSEITLNAAGIDNMIKQLELFRDQLQEEDDE